MERKNESVKRKALGRGLSALLTATAPPAAPPAAGRDPGFLSIPVEKVRAGSLQPRRTFAPEALEELVASIREKGILQPVLVRPTADGYELVAGERRFRAAEAAGLSTIPAVVRRLSDREALEAALVENVQRADLNPVELAEGYQRLARDFSLSQEQIAERVGKDRATVSNTVRLLRLPSPVRQAVADGRISAGHARALLSAPPEQAASICETVLRRGLSVRETERLCGAPAKRKAARRSASPDADMKRLEEELSRRGGTRVRLRGTPKKGRIEISWFSSAELDRLCDVLFSGR
ncbi:MAG: ParB/RepB/Spo0J family partition protein ParB [Deltaproteobacteria bacterium]